ncbi:MAG: ribbon-helix-helix protein, CopG family [Desulfobacteraceae bacterium]|nr:MAG: ribbon-helix-helix protein, CopG family [Desulfobacteraceae bacterium]
MKTVQMTLGEDLIAEIDRVAAQIGTTRSEFTRQALREALAQMKEKEKEARHKQGYLKKPVKKDEFSDWENELEWGDA